MFPSVRFVPARTAFARPGPGASRSPTSWLLCSPPTSCLPSDSAPVPLAFVLPPQRSLLLCRVTQASASVYPSEIFFLRLPVPVSPVSLLEEKSGPPRLLSRPLHACHGLTPRQACRPLAHFLRLRHFCFQGGEPPGHLEYRVFRGRIPVAHMLVDLRIAEMVTHFGARPYYRLAGLSFSRVGFAPTGRRTEFPVVSPPPSLRTSLAWSLLAFSLSPFECGKPSYRAPLFFK